MRILIWAIVIYFMIGISITAFCVHMSYHESGIGFGDNDDYKAQKVLESKMGPLGFVFLCALWPIAVLIAFRGKPKQEAASQAKELEQAVSVTKESQE